MQRWPHVRVGFLVVLLSFALLLVPPPSAGTHVVGHAVDYLVCETAYLVDTAGDAYRATRDGAGSQAREVLDHVYETREWVESTERDVNGVVVNTVDETRRHAWTAVGETQDTASALVRVAGDAAVATARRAGEWTRDRAEDARDATLEAYAAARRAAREHSERAWPLAASAAVAPAWAPSDAGGARFDDAAADAAGNVFAFGSARTSFNTWQYHLVKHDRDGNVLWRIDLPPGVLGSGLGLAGNGDAIVVGWGWDAARQVSDIRTLRVQGADGRVVWSASEIVSDYNYGADAAVAPDGSVYVAGTAMRATGNPELVLLKYDANGALAWRRAYAPGYEANAAAVAVDGAGDPAIVGWTYAVRPRPQGGFESRNGALAVKFDASGNLRWQTEWWGAGRSTSAHGAAFDAQGRLHLAGAAHGSSAHDADMLHVVIADRGAATPGRVLSAQRYDLGGDEIAFALHVESDGGIVLAGSGTSPLRGKAGSNPGAGRDLVLLRADAAGAPVWTRRVDLGRDEWATGVAVVPARVPLTNAPAGHPLVVTVGVSEHVDASGHVGYRGIVLAHRDLSSGVVAGRDRVRPLL